MSLDQSDQANSIYMNTIQGRKLNCCITKDLNTHNIFLFLITKETDTLGPILGNEFKCDFMLIKFEVPFENIKLDEDQDMIEQFANSREVRQPWNDQIKTQNKLSPM